MVFALFGIVIGLALGWFSYRHQAFFIAACISAGLILALVTSRLWPIVFVAERYRRTQETVLGQLIAKIPTALIVMISVVLITSIIVRILLHIEARCYTDPPPELTREQLREKLYAEMKYSDDLLD